MKSQWFQALLRSGSLSYLRTWTKHDLVKASGKFPLPSIITIFFLLFFFFPFCLFTGRISVAIKTMTNCDNISLSDQLHLNHISITFLNNLPHNFLITSLISYSWCVQASKFFLSINKKLYYILIVLFLLSTSRFALFNSSVCIIML